MKTKLFTLFITAFSMLHASDALTTIADTLYSGDGTTINGAFTIDYPSITLPGGTTVQKGSQVYQITNGVVNIALYPNDVAYPARTSYRVNYNLVSQAGTISYKEYWVVPTSLTPVSVASVRTTSIPVPNLLFSCNQLPSGCPTSTVSGGLSNYKTYTLSTTSSSITITAAQHGLGPNILVDTLDSNGVAVEISTTLDPAGNFGATWDVPFTSPGSVVLYSGTPISKNYSSPFTSISTLSLTGYTNPINSQEYGMQCWDSSTSLYLDALDFSIDADLNVVVNFGFPSSGRCVFGLLK